eukprot:GHUV01039315.1.p1 GENE.GHUV01039315.1~~GHUV01039315.1.p1  ORF type:complete len:209 (-),score=52.02 GHUV01039315.1:784-1410(-)
MCNSSDSAAMKKPHQLQRFQLSNCIRTVQAVHNILAITVPVGINRTSPTQQPALLQMTLRTTSALILLLQLPFQAQDKLIHTTTAGCRVFLARVDSPAVPQQQQNHLHAEAIAEFITLAAFAWIKLRTSPSSSEAGAAAVSSYAAPPEPPAVPVQLPVLLFLLHAGQQQQRSQPVQHHLAELVPDPACLQKHGQRVQHGLTPSISTDV